MSFYFHTFYAGDRIELISIKFLFFAILACTSIITPEIDLGEKFLKRSTKMDKNLKGAKMSRTSQWKTMEKMSARKVRGCPSN